MTGVIRMFDKRPLSLKLDEGLSAEIARRRPEAETHIVRRPDRVRPYIMHRMDEMSFDEFSPAFLKRANLQKELFGVPIPLRTEDMEMFKTGSVQSNVIAENMARVIGIDTKFQYRDSYLAFIRRNFGEKAVENMTKKAKDFAELEKYEDACIYFRAALVLKYNDLAAMYGYARILRTLYSEGKTEDYIGNLKAESLDYFELATEFYPRFDMAWYYLGYMYLNLGLYMKARLAWDEYMKYGRVQKDRREIKKRIGQIEEPVEIEKGYNAILSGRWDRGLEILERYMDSRFSDWWPLWYYLGVAYARTERIDDAEMAFRRVLKSSPRHIESMKELITIYETRNDSLNIKKYTAKIALIQE